MDGEKLRELREAMGLTRKQVEYDTGVSREAIANIESGRTTECRVSTARKLADYYGVAIEDLLSE